MSRPLLLALVLMVGCTACRRENGDTISLSGAAGPTATTLLLDGRRASCVDDERLSGSGSLTIANLLAPANCTSEIAAFAEDRAMQLLAPVTTWTDNAGDTLSVTMAPLLNVPLAVWILFQNANNTRATEVQLEVNRAAQLYDTEQCGVEFTAAVTDVSRRQFPFQLLEASCDSMAAFKAVASQPRSINVYYIESVNGDQGRRCPDGNSDVILIGASRNDSETLAHEIGHALSLGHWNDTQGIGGDNLMLSPGSGRNSISIGQCFRGNVNTDSVLNRSRLRAGPTRSCPDSTTSGLCPSLGIQ